MADRYDEPDDAALVPEDFDSLFEGLTGHRPMGWQTRLFFDYFLNGTPPSSLDLPTGLGKTSVMAIWLIARAFQPALPRRLVYVVDRRAVVDQATDEAVMLRKMLQEKQAKPHIERLAAALGLTEGKELPISTLRGQFIDNKEWLNDPAGTAIVVGTVDMIGSRVLFSGYGVSRKMRPYHAAMLGVDSLVVLDEAHLVPPFEQLLKAIETRAAEFGPIRDEGRAVIPRFRLLSLSATGGPPSGETFSLLDSDLADPIVARRLGARKRVRIVTPEAEQKLEDVLAEEAWKLCGDGAAFVRCIVYCDSRKIADKVKEKLDKLGAAVHKQSKESRKVETALFVGARRAKEREEAAGQVADLGFIAGSDVPLRAPAFLIATSAAEVGVNLDGDHLVCDAVAWERMIQRLGRVNRLGRGDATVTVVKTEVALKKPGQPDEAEQRTLRGHAAAALLEELPAGESGYDASPGALRELKLRAERDSHLRDRIRAATTPAPLYPALTRPLIDAWSMTSLKTHPGWPEIAPWLRGWVDDEPQTSVIWRTYLPVRLDGKAVGDPEVEGYFEAAPPHTSEMLETETRLVVDWLVDRANAVIQRSRTNRAGTGRDADPVEPLDDVGASEPSAQENVETDSDQPPAPPLPGGSLRRDDVVAYALRPDGSLKKLFQGRELLPSQKTEQPAAEADESDEASPGRSKLPNVKKMLMRALADNLLVVDARIGGLEGGLLDSKSETTPPAIDGREPWLGNVETEGSVQPIVRFRVRACSAEQEASDTDARWYERRRFVQNDSDGDPTRWLVIEKWKDDAATEDDRSEGKLQLLDAHTELVMRKCLAITQALRLDPALSEMLQVAARLHDEGKSAANWQAAFGTPKDGKVYAKTPRLVQPKKLNGYRHEFGSLLHAHSDLECRCLADDLPALCLHLIVAHHGNARPIIPVDGCQEAPPSRLAQHACDAAMRFAELQRVWGPWGLAWLETILRAADQQASRDYKELVAPGATEQEATSNG